MQCSLHPRPHPQRAWAGDETECNGHMHATCSDLWAGVSMLKSGVNLCDRNLITESLWKLLTL